MFLEQNFFINYNPELLCLISELVPEWLILLKWTKTVMRFRSSPFPTPHFLLWMRFAWPKICTLYILMCPLPWLRCSSIRTDFTPESQRLVWDVLGFPEPQMVVVDKLVTGACSPEQGCSAFHLRENCFLPIIVGFLKWSLSAWSWSSTPPISCPSFSRLDSELILTVQFKNASNWHV